MEDYLDNKEFSERIRNLLNQGIEDGVFPGAVAYIYEKGKTLFYGAIGNRAIKPTIKPMYKDTIFDLASLTKPIVTATLTMQLVEKRILRLDQEIINIVEGFSKSGITIKHLLTHTSGLPAWQPLYLRVDKPENVVSYLGNIPLEYETGNQVIYSCLGYILLGKLIESVTGKNLQSLALEHIFQPLGMHNTFYNPTSEYTERCAATEDSSSFQRRMTENYDSFPSLKRNWREDVIVGEVHDENAFWLGGIAGNAGLFSTAEDLAKYCVSLLEGENNILSQESINLIRRNYTKCLDGSRGLGWIIMSDGSLYHTGFTGTSIRIHIDRKIFAILLTNRVHPDANNAGILEFRDKFYKIFSQQSAIV